jgi:TonB family protein
MKHLFNYCEKQNRFLFSCCSLLILGITCSLNAQTAYWAATYKEHIKRGSTVLVAKEGYTFEQTSYGLYIEKFYNNSEHPLREVITYADRRKKVLEGPWQVFYANGQVQVTGRYIEGEKAGRWYYYREDGELWKSCTCTDGIEDCELEEKEVISEVPPSNVRDYTQKAEDANATRSTDEEPVFKVVEEMPRFPGCEEEHSLNERQQCAQTALLKNIYSRLKLPPGYEGPEGTLVITFVVEADGAITNARVVRSLEERVDQKALDLVNSFPNFIPGKQRGESIRTQFNLPISIKLK